MPDRMDEAIDRAVREMLDVEPTADLRERVIARLPAAGSRPPAFGWAIAPLAAAALIVFAVIVARHSEPAAPSSLVAVHGSDQRLQVEVVAHARAQEAAHRMAPTRAVTAPRRPPSVGKAATTTAVIIEATVAVDNASTRLEPLSTIAPISIAPIEQERIVPAAITMRPLTRVDELQIAPLTPPDRR